MPTSPSPQRLTTSCAQHSLQASSTVGTGPQAAAWLPQERWELPMGQADGTVLLKMDGDLELKLRMELSAKHQAIQKLTVWDTYLFFPLPWSPFKTYPLPTFHCQRSIALIAPTHLLMIPTPSRFSTGFRLINALYGALSQFRPCRAEGLLQLL